MIFAPTPEVKAKELFEFYFHLKFQHFTSVRNSKIIGMPKCAAKECATETVNEILKSGTSPGICIQLEDDKWIRWSAYYELVKQEIEKL